MGQVPGVRFQDADTMMGTEMLPSQSPIYHLQITEFLSAADFRRFEDQEDRVDEEYPGWQRRRWQGCHSGRGTEC